MDSDRNCPASSLAALESWRKNLMTWNCCGNMENAIFNEHHGTGGSTFLCIPLDFAQAQSVPEKLRKSVQQIW
jgi:hypothetical protein